jgi:hypothetical protein
VKFDPEPIFQETDDADSAWSLWVTFRLCLIAVLIWAALSAGYLLWLEIF